LLKEVGIFLPLVAKLHPVKAAIPGKHRNVGDNVISAADPLDHSIALALAALVLLLIICTTTLMNVQMAGYHGRFETAGTGSSRHARARGRGHICHSYCAIWWAYWRTLRPHALSQSNHRIRDQNRTQGWLHDPSMIGIFMEALVRFGTVVTIKAGFGAVAF
jgi:hypothetical protein